MYLKDLFEKIENKQEVPEWITIKCKIPKKIQEACGWKFDPDKGYREDNMSFHWNDTYKDYFGLTHQITSLWDIKSSYKKEISDNFEIIDCIASEEQKQLHSKYDNALSNLASLGIYIS